MAIKQVGDRHGEWVILEKVGRHSLCECSCGAVKRVETGTLGTSSTSCGHIRSPGIRDTAGERTCTRCLVTKPTQEFHKDSDNSSGCRPKCKACTKEYDDSVATTRAEKARIKYQANPAKKIAKTSEYRRSHPEYGFISRRVEMGKGVVVGDATPESLNKRLYEVFSNKCYICDVIFKEGKLHWDHYRPISKGGDHSLDNLWAACQQCNQRKNARWPFTEDMKTRIATEVRALRASQADLPVKDGLEVH